MELEHSEEIKLQAKTCPLCQETGPEQLNAHTIQAIPLHFAQHLEEISAQALPRAVESEASTISTFDSVISDFPPDAEHPFTPWSLPLQHPPSSFEKQQVESSGASEVRDVRAATFYSTEAPKFGSHRRGPWSQSEDQILMALVSRQGSSNWVRISSCIGTRSPKQCRERYHQNLKPTLNHTPITEHEGRQIEEMVRTIGKRWGEIARRLPGRSDNAVKNWWNGVRNRQELKTCAHCKTQKLRGEIDPSGVCKTCQAVQQSAGASKPGAVISEVRYSKFDVYQMEVDGIIVTRRITDSWLNATQILKIAGIEQGKRTKILEKEIRPYEHEEIPDGYGAYEDTFNCLLADKSGRTNIYYRLEGVWVDLDRGSELCREHGVEERLRPLLEIPLRRLPEFQHKLPPLQYGSPREGPGSPSTKLPPIGPLIEMAEQADEGAKLPRKICHLKSPI